MEYMDKAEEKRQCGDEQPDPRERPIKIAGMMDLNMGVLMGEKMESSQGELIPFPCEEIGETGFPERKIIDYS